MITKNLSESAVEINCIFENMPKELLDKIPTKLQNLFKEIASKDYKFEYDTNKKLNEQNIQEKTKGIIALIYKDYICNEAEQKEYINEYKKFLEIEEQIQKEKYNQNTIFKSKKGVNANTSENTLSIIPEKSSWFKNFISKIKNILKKR